MYIPDQTQAMLVALKMFLIIDYLTENIKDIQCSP